MDNGGRLFDAMPYEIATGYSKGKTGVKKTRSAIADEFAESTAFYKDLDAAQRKVFFGTEKLETGPIGESFRQRLEEAGITRFTNEDGTVDYEAAIREFKRQWTNYERGKEILKERSDYDEARAKAFVEEMERVEAAEREAMDQISTEEAAAREEAAKSGMMFSRSGIFTGSAADYEKPSLKKIGTGEGMQVYGWGLYGSTERGVGESYATYRDSDHAIILVDGKEWKPGEKATSGERTAYEQLDDFSNSPEEIAAYCESQEGKHYKEAAKFIRSHKIDIKEPHTYLYEQTFFTNRKPGDESHLLKWYEPVSKEHFKRILDLYAKEHDGADLRADTPSGTLTLEDYGDRRLFQNELKDNERTMLKSGGDLYSYLEGVLHSPKAASEFLYRAGIDGVKYPVDSYGKTVKDGDKAGWNYVAFSDEHMRVDHKWRDGQLLFSRAVKPSALGDGKQRYYEVPFDKAVDKIVKNKKPVSRDYVFVSETPKVFEDIGFVKLPVMMGQGHVISCYFGEGEGVEGKHLHKMKGNLKLLPKALEKPLMIITSETSPSDSVVAILNMKDNTGASVIVPVKMSGVGRAGKDLVDAHIALTMFGKKNAWKSLVANAIEKESNGEVGVFYIDGTESKTILERLGDKAKGLGIAGLQSPGETKANAFNFGKVERQLLKVAKGTVHSIADFGSPVKGVGAQTDSRQFKNWFADSKVVDDNGKPLVVYRGAEFDPLAQGNGKGVIKPEAYFTADPNYARRYKGENGAVRAYYLNIKKPFDIRNPETREGRTPLVG